MAESPKAENSFLVRSWSRFPGLSLKFDCYEPLAKFPSSDEDVVSRGILML